MRFKGDRYSVRRACGPFVQAAIDDLVAGTASIAANPFILYHVSRRICIMIISVRAYNGPKTRLYYILYILVLQSGFDSRLVRFKVNFIFIYFRYQIYINLSNLAPLKEREPMSHTILIEKESIRVHHQPLSHFWASTVLTSLMEQSLDYHILIILRGNR